MTGSRPRGACGCSRLAMRDEPGRPTPRACRSRRPTSRSYARRSGTTGARRWPCGSERPRGRSSVRGTRARPGRWPPGTWLPSCPCEWPEPRNDGRGGGGGRPPSGRGWGSRRSVFVLGVLLLAGLVFGFVLVLGPGLGGGRRRGRDRGAQRRLPVPLADGLGGESCQHPIQVLFQRVAVRHQGLLLAPSERLINAMEPHARGRKAAPPGSVCEPEAAIGREAPPTRCPPGNTRYLHGVSTSGAFTRTGDPRYDGHSAARGGPYFCARAPVNEIGPEDPRGR